VKSYKKALCVLVSCLLAVSLTACGQSGSQGTGTPSSTETKYPEKPINVLQGFKAGGGSDQLAQLTQPTLQKILGQSFVNQYIPGATGAIAWTQLAKSTKNDAYTLSITNTPMVMTNYIMNEEIKYSVDEFDALANVVTDPGIIVVGKDSKYKSFNDLLADIKANPGKVTVGNSGIGGDDFFTTLLFQKASGLTVQMVPFDGDGPSWQAAAAGKVEVSFNNLGVTYPQVKAGNLIPLAVFSEKRIDMIPDIPTIKELGFDVVSGSSRGYCAPKGIPADAKAKLLKAFEEMSKDPEFIKQAENLALPVDIKIGDDYAKYLKDQETAFKQIWNEVKDQYQK
jgi:putative tricarboxylic transport membrane protein